MVVVVVVTIYVVCVCARLVLDQDQAFWSALQLQSLAWLAAASQQCTYQHTQTLHTPTLVLVTICYTYTSSPNVQIATMSQISGSISLFYWAHNFCSSDYTGHFGIHPGHIILVTMIITPCAVSPSTGLSRWRAWLASVRPQPSALTLSTTTHTHTGTACIQEIKY